MVRQNRTRKIRPSIFLRRLFRCHVVFRRLMNLANPCARNSQAGHVAAAVAPVVAVAAVAQVTAMAVLDHEIKEGLAAQIFGQREGAGLVDPHQRRMQCEALVEAERERDLHGLDGVVAAIGIAGIIGLAHAGDEMAGAAAIGDGAGEAEEDQIAAGHEGGRQAAVGDLDRGVAGERGVGNGGERIERDEVVLAQPRFPAGIERRPCARGCARADRARWRGAGHRRSRWFPRAKIARAPRPGRRWNPARRRTERARCRRRSTCPMTTIFCARRANGRARQPRKSRSDGHRRATE